MERSLTLTNGDKEPVINVRNVRNISRKENKNKTWVSHLASVSSNNSGNYTCLVTNASGENGNKTVEVVVEGKVPGLC